MIRRLPQSIKAFLVKLGFKLRIESDDRRILEQIVLPDFGKSPNVKRVLFVGCDWYTSWYHEFFPNAEYWTMEIDPSRALFGSKHHVIDGVQNVTKHFQPGSLDLIVCNGVFGCGLNERPEVEHAFAGMASCLSPGGVFVLGWNDRPPRNPFPPEEAALLSFDRHIYPPLKDWRIRTTNDNGHTYDFYVPKAARAA